MGEKWPVNFSCDSDFHVNRRCLFTCRKSATWEGMLWIFSPEKSDGLGRVRTRDLGVPEASMLTTRPPKPLARAISPHCNETAELYNFSNIYVLNGRSLAGNNRS
jgi:hypothetical protein